MPAKWHSKAVEHGSEHAVAEPYAIPNDIKLGLADSAYSGRTIADVLGRKLLRKIMRRARGQQPVVTYNGIVVFDSPGLDGGGLTEGQDFLRTLLELDIKPCQRLFEFCAGPGYIGYNLLANGFCRTLALADVNPAAVDAARATARFNGLDSLVSVYLSDVLDGIPGEEQWDVVVGTPPWTDGTGEVLCHDPKYNVHRRFYAGVKRFMRPGGRVVLLEGRSDSDPAIFAHMIAAGCGRLVAIRPMMTLLGKHMNPYYVISEW